MSRRTLCDPPAGWQDRIDFLADQSPPVDGTILLGVELALELAWRLGYESETALVVPALLSGTPMYGAARAAKERLALANVGQITPYSASSAWRTDLAAYRLLPDEWRHYDFSRPAPNPDDDTAAPGELSEERDDWEKRLLCIARKPEANQRHEAHKRLYDDCLTKRLLFHERRGVYAVADTTYRFRAELTNGEWAEANVRFPPQLLTVINNAPPLPWPDRLREPFTVDLHRDLAPIARFFDEADEEAGRSSSQWQARLQKIEYRPVLPDGEPSATEKNVLRLDGFHHAAGMVASGKSTLASLLAGYIAKVCPQKRITLVVGDNQTVLRLVNQLNTYFCPDIHADAPVAVPLMGRRSRNKQLRDLHGTADWQAHWAQYKPHWGERFLSTACPLQGLIEADTIARDWNGRPLQPGREPCAALQLPKNPRAARRGGDDPLAKTKHLCPLYARCPVHRATHDMAGAAIWVTTPQAMTLGALPRQAEARPVHIGEIVYEQSDIVVVDEADAVMGVLDETFAKSEDLTNGNSGRNGGIYDRVGAQTERFVIDRRATMSGGQLRWSQAQRGGQNASQILLSLLNDPFAPFLKKWIEREYFTPWALFHRLARRLAGQTEYAPPDESREVKQLVDDCEEPFKALFGRRVPDALTPHRVRAEHERRQGLEVVERDEPAYELWQILRDIDAEGDRIFHQDESMIARCKQWLKVAYPQWPERAQGLRARLRQQAQASEEEAKTATGKETKKRAKRRAVALERQAAEVDTEEKLAYRLLFALTAALLDRHTYIIFAEWSRRTAPDEEDTEPHQNTPPYLRDVLPLPPLGRQFGTYYPPGDAAAPGGNPNRLSFLSYTNIGRAYLLRFHELFSDLQGRPGPHVLALSGTSYLPDAVRLHLGSGRSKPQGLLLPEKEAQDAIGQSEFTFLPLRDGDDLPIRVSGAGNPAEMALALQTLARKLAGPNGGYLANELAELEKLGRNKSDLWADRARLLLLVNSYDQARLAAAALQEAWPAEKERIFYLSRVDGENNDVLGGGNLGAAPPANAVSRPDIETFGTHTDGRILVAPISAIGRGYNILNKVEKAAAFGALYFLIRPYPHPDDMTALAREMNRRTLDWADNPDFAAWNAASLEEQFQILRRTASEYWDAAQRRQYWGTLHDYPEWECAPRRDLAAFTAGLLVQAAGRLLRGGVPFRAYFADAAFAMQAARHPEGSPLDALATKDAPQTSLLAAVIVLMRDLVHEDPLARALYEPLADALCDTKFRDGNLPYDDHWNNREKKQ